MFRESFERKPRDSRTSAGQYTLISWPSFKPAHPGDRRSIKIRGAFHSKRMHRRRCLEQGNFLRRQTLVHRCFPRYSQKNPRPYTVLSILCDYRLCFRSSARYFDVQRAGEDLGESFLLSNPFERTGLFEQRNIWRTEYRSEMPCLASRGCSFRDTENREGKVA